MSNYNLPPGVTNNDIEDAQEHDEPLKETSCDYTNVDHRCSNCGKYHRRYIPPMEDFWASGT